MTFKVIVGVMLEVDEIFIRGHGQCQEMTSVPIGTIFC